MAKLPARCWLAADKSNWRWVTGSWIRMRGSSFGGFASSTDSPAHSSLNRAGIRPAHAACGGRQELPTQITWDSQAIRSVQCQVWGVPNNWHGFNDEESVNRAALIVRNTRPAPPLRNVQSPLKLPCSESGVLHQFRPFEGASPQPSTPGDVRSAMRSDIARWAKLIKDARIQMD